jgi:hypothetical protein
MIRNRVLRADEPTPDYAPNPGLNPVPLRLFPQNAQGPKRKKKGAKKKEKEKAAATIIT